MRTIILILIVSACGMTTSNTDVTCNGKLSIALTMSSCTVPVKPGTVLGGSDTDVYCGNQVNCPVQGVELTCYSGGFDNGSDCYAYPLFTVADGSNGHDSITAEVAERQDGVRGLAIVGSDGSCTFEECE